MGSRDTQPLLLHAIAPFAPMSLIYYSSKLAAKAVQAPEFVTREITGQTTARAGDCVIIGFPHVKQLAYDEYRSNICAFLFATAKQQRIACDATYYSPQLDSSLFLPLPLPSLVVAPNEPILNEDARTDFLKALKVQAEVIRYINQPMYLIHNISIAALKTLPPVNTIAASPPNATSLFGLKQYLITVKAVSLFLATHSYPAFSAEDDDDSIYEDHSHIASSKPLKPIATLRFNPDDSKITKEEETIFAVDAPFAEDDESWVRAKVTMRAANSVTVAKPAPLRPSINYGPPNEVPYLPGYVFPYFQNMMEPALGVLKSTFSSLFMNLLGDSQEKLEAGWRDWARGAGYWYKTEQGMVMFHILQLIRIALDAQARLFLIISNGRYLGAAILGAKFTIFKGGEAIRPGTNDQVQLRVQELDEHGKALTKICEVLSGLDIRDEIISTQTITPRQIRGTRHLFEEIQRREKAEGSDLEELTEQLGRLNFVENYHTFHLDKITELMRRLALSEEYSSPAPMHLPPAHIYDQSLEFNILSVFGPMAPSFVDQRGTEYPIPTGPSAPDPLSVVDPVTGKRPLDFILISGKKLTTAVNDLVHVRKQRKIRQNPMERAAGYRTIKFTGNGRSQIWDMMKLIPYEKSKGKKRMGADDEDVDMDRPAKKSKKDREDIEVTFDEFWYEKILSSISTNR